jgi:glycosyltransferase involved in cell wall biosynthesis
MSCQQTVQRYVSSLAVSISLCNWKKELNGFQKEKVMRNFTIAYVIGDLPFGGVENLLLDLTTELAARGHRPVVFNLSGTGDIVSFFVANGIRIINIGNSIDALKTFHFPTLFRLRRAFKELQPDVIHTMHFSADYFGRLASLGLKIPVVTHLHNARKTTKIHRNIANKVLSYATDCFISVSRAVYDNVQMTHNMARRPSFVVYNAINQKKFEAEPLNLTQAFGIQGKTIIAIARLVKLKNLDMLVKAFARIHAQHADTSLLIVGEGPERKHLQNLIDALALSECAVLAGYRSDVGALLKGAYVFAMPSDSEGLPITHLEAMYCELPSVISEFVPSREIAEGACLICQTTVESIYECLNKIIDDATLASDLSRVAKQCAQQYGIDTYADQMLEIYERVMFA